MDNVENLDPGLLALDKLYRDFMVDDEWSVRSERQFEWVGHRLSQTISAAPGVKDDGLDVYKINSRTNVLRSVKASEDKIHRILAEQNQYAVGSCYIYDPKSKSVRSECWIYLHQEVWDWKTKFFSCFVLTQLCISEDQANYLADELDAEVDVYAHPASGLRNTPDDMMGIVMSVFQPEGQKPSLFADKFEFETVGEEARKSPYAATIGGSAEGIALETSFGDYTALSILTTQMAHPLLGNGLTGLVKIPSPATQEEGCRIADYLNRAESIEFHYGHQLGAWCFDRSGSDTSGSITYRFFYPNIVYRKGMIFDAAYSAVGRARWADRIMNFTPTEPNAWKQMDERLKQFYG